ncbi:hypothetical protein [Xenorhabdus sp. NBAII XenSa04]|uniref:hypothetical protein n=1 Tax=Xenorhabdus sp. NBAII XenSa04 TaxID=1429873 RepID=UPI00404018E3
MTISANPNDTPHVEIALSYPVSLNEFIVGSIVSVGDRFLTNVSLHCSWMAIGY